MIIFYADIEGETEFMERFEEEAGLNSVLK